MSNLPPPGPLPDPEALQALNRRFEAARAACPDLANAELNEVLRIVPGKRAIMAGTLDGRAAVFRMFDPDKGDMSTREWHEMTRIWPFMSAGAYRIAAPFLHVPEHGLLVIEHVNGTPLLEHLWQSDPKERAQHLRPAAEWLRHYSEGSESWRAGNAAGWLARCERAAATQPFAKLRKIEAEILDELRRMDAALAGQEWRVAICHGDFHPNNLILGADRLTGIDIGGSARMPVCKDIARFLVHMGRRGMIPSGARRFGVDQQGLAAFAQAFGLTSVERGLWLPFFIGCEALIRVEGKGLKPGRIKRAEEMYAALRDDLVAARRA
ncbi:MAG: phosphotransferase [Roseovarius sp.]|nr:phosphotransferase [Roseovarius sp.]